MTKVKTPTISIGIPVYNEEQNIQPLLKSLISQVEQGYKLIEIIVISDGSTDSTDKKIKAVKDKRIALINDKKRKGKSQRLNEIFNRFKGDILILLDADILIRDENLFTKVAETKIIEKAGTVAVNLVPLSAQTFFEKCINYSVEIQMTLRKKWNQGNNYLAFHGACMILNRKFSKSLKLSDKIVNNDAYIYFAAKQQSFKPIYRSDIKVYFQSPKTFRDHLNQSSRYKSSFSELSKIFKIEKKDYQIPLILSITTLLWYFCKNPVLFIGYISIFLATKIKEQKMSSKWESAISTKQIVKFK